MRPFIYAFRNVKYCIWLLLALSVFLAGSAGRVWAYPSLAEKTFFSYKRFYLNKDIAKDISGDARIRKTLEAFMEAYSAALDSISKGDLRSAERSLVKAREIWPEYFGTDFLLGIIYEKDFSYKKAARYYKSYLNKLNTFHSGGYRVSEQLIHALSKQPVEQYDYAYDLVKMRFESQKINLVWVLPVFTAPVFLLPSLIIIAVAVFYGAASFWIIPYFKKQYRFKNPPANFWICRSCETANPELNKVCQKCARGR